MLSLDIIIPTYKNKMGLYKTIFSLGLNNRYDITIVDDCSGINYDDLVEYFSPFHNINVIYLEENSGPGIARQTGLNNTSNDLVFFIDTGDLMTSPDALENLLFEFNQYEGIEALFSAHLEENSDFSTKYVDNVHNRLHGKLFKRSFLDKYNISFPEECSRKNEDLGFCLLARLINREIHELTGKEVIAYSDNAFVLWKHDDNSLVRKNDYAFYFKEQNMGMAVASCYAFDKAKDLGVRDEFIDDIGYNFFTATYFFYLITCHSRPEFSEESLEGAVYFYKNWFKKLDKINEEQLVQEYYNNLQDYSSDWALQKKLINLNFIQYLQLLETESQK